MPQNSRQLVVVADDQRDIRALIEICLEHAGYEVAQAADGLEAVQVIRDRCPDLAVLDIRMPEMSGLEVLHAIRNDRLTARLPVVLLTAAAQGDDVSRRLKEGADAYLVKPFSPHELVERVSSLLDRD